MAQSLDLRVSILDSKAKVELKEIDGKIQQIQKRAEKGINLVSSVETRDAQGKLKGIVDTYKDAADKIEVYAQRINKSGNVSFSVTEKSGVNWAEKQAQAYGKAIIKQEELERSFTKITASVSSFASLSDQAFQQYSTGAMSAAKATEESARAVQISARDWQAMWNTFHNIGVECGVTANDVSVFGRLSDDAFNLYSTGAMSADAANQSLRASAEDVAQEEQQVAQETENAANQAERSSKAFGLLHTVFLRLAHTAISAVTRSLRTALTEMKNVDSELVVVRKVSDATAEELAVLKDRAYEVGAAYGVAASDYLNAAAEMSRAGYREQAGDLAELATKIQLVGDVSQDVANKFLIATDKSYKMNGNFEKLSSTIDKLNEIDNNFATSFEKVADGIGLLAPVAAQAHVSFEEMAAAIGTVTAVTQRSGTESARALRSLYLNILKDTKTEIDDGVTWTVEEINNLQDALRKYAPDVVKAAEATGELINPMEAVGALAQSYKEGLLDEQKLFEIVSGLGGKLRTSQLLALIQNWDMYNQMLDKTADAAGSADKEVSNALDSWDKKLQQLKNTFTQFTASILDTDEIKGLLDAVNYFIKSLDEPEKYTQKFVESFEKAIHSLVEKLPRLQEVISHAALLLVKTFLETLKNELPTILKSLSDGARKATKELEKELPDILQSLFTALAELITTSVLDADLAVDLATDLVWGIIEALPNVIIGAVDGIAWAVEKGFSDGNVIPKIIEKIAKLTGGISGSLLMKGVEALFGADGESGSGSSVGDVYRKTSDEIEKATKGIIDVGEDFVELIEEQADAVESLSDKLKGATKALEDYKDALKDGEKGDTLKSYAEAYNDAMEMFEKGMTGSNAYMAAVDLLLTPEQMRKLGWDYEKAGEELSKPFYKALFEGGGDDFGATAANYIREHINEFKGVSVFENGDGTFNLDFTDIDEFAKSAGIMTDAVYALIDALDIYDSAATYTNEEIYEILNKFASIDENGVVNLTKTIQNLIADGKSEREIYRIVDAIKSIPDLEINEPEELDDTIQSLMKINEEVADDKNLEVVVTSNAEDVFGEIKKEIKTLDGSVIRVYVKRNLLDGEYRNAVGTFGGHGGKFASGTSSARGGLSLVNEEGAEIIYANGRAWIAGGGDPTITNLPIGAGVFNAKQTREILTRSGINSFASVANIPIDDGGDGGDGKPQIKSLKKPRTKSLKKLLDEISKYIDEILQKAKDALQEQLDAIDEQIDKLKREHDAEEDANKLEELRLNILEAEQRLAEAQNERTVRYFNKETGQWEWMADQKAVAEAEKELQEARDAYDKEVAEQAYEAQIQQLEDQKDALEDAYDELEKKWDDILSELESIVNGDKTTDIGKLLQQLLGTKGGSYAPDIQALLEAIGAFTANQTSALDAETTAKIMSFNGTGGATSVLSAVLGSGSYDLNGKAQSTLGGNTSIVGDTIYYINGVHIGSDMVDKPLSQILSVLPIYAC